MEYVVDHFSSSSGSCSSTTFSTLGLKYSKVCGQVRGYQYCNPDAFEPLSEGIDIYYVHDVYEQNPHTHIWTYAGGRQEDRVHQYSYPCNTGYSGSANVLSSFVGNHYYCVSGLDPGKSLTPILYVNDPLWDGKSCDSSKAACCTNSMMPWFYRVLDDMTQDDIELS